MSTGSNTEELGIRLSAEGLPETTNGIKLLGDRIEGLGGQADKTSPKLAGVGKSAKETQAAMRQLPAQITDVVTSLASGQPVWLVAIQQGGQIKDSFGGIVPAFKAVTSAVTPMNLALGALGVTVGALTIAHELGQREAFAYHRALVMTNNAAGSSVTALANMARDVSSVVGTQGQAAEVLAAMVNTGEVAAAQLRGASIATVKAMRDLGMESTDVVRAFAELGRAPLEASEKFNRGMNYLTAATYEQIRALMAQGKEEEAAALAQRTYADALSQRADTVGSQLGTLQRLWRHLGDEARQSWDAMLGVGRNDLETRLKELQSRMGMAMRLQENTGGSGLMAMLGARWEASLLEERRALNRSMLNESERGAGDAAAVLDTKAYIAAREANDRWTQAALTNAQKRDQALEKYRKNNETLSRGGAVLDPAQVAREEAAIRAQFADPKGPAGARAEEPYRALNDEVARRIALADAELVAGGKLSEADRVRIELMARLQETSRRTGAAQQAGDAMMIDYAAERVRQVEAQRQALQSQAEAERRSTQERAAATQAAQREVLTLQQQRQALENETAEIGLSSRAIFERRQILEESTIRTMEDKLARIEGLPAYADEAVALREQIRLRREMLGLRAEKFDKTEQQQEQDAAARRRDTMASSIADGIVNGFREGRGMADIFFRELKAQAARTVLRMPIQMLAASGNDMIAKLVGLFTPTGSSGSSPAGGSPVGDNWVGPRAFGGSTKAGKLYQVNERGPELLSSGGKTFLMMGAKDGYVTPNGGAAPASGGSRTVNLSFSPVVNIDSRTDRAEVAALVSRSLEASKAELLEMMDRNMV